MAVGTSDVGRGPQARGLGEHVVTVLCPGTLWAKALPCPTVSSSSCSSEQNEAMASSLCSSTGGAWQGSCRKRVWVVVTAAHRPSRVHVDSIILLEKPVLQPQSTGAHTSSPLSSCVCGSASWLPSVRVSHAVPAQWSALVTAVGGPVCERQLLTYSRFVSGPGSGSGSGMGLCHATTFRSSTVASSGVSPGRPG